jgi:hypothetical protein
MFKDYLQKYVMFKKIFQNIWILAMFLKHQLKYLMNVFQYFILIRFI